MPKPYDTKSGRALTPMEDFLQYLVKEEGLYDFTIKARIGEDGFNKLLSNGLIRKDPHLENLYMITPEGIEVAKDPKKLEKILYSES